MTSESPEDRASAPPPAAAAPASEQLPAEPKVIVSPGFVKLLLDLRVAVLVSTYDAGKVFLLRAHGNAVNVHFVAFDKAMGIAATPQRLMVGTRTRVRDLDNMPALTPRLPPSSLESAQYDACYVPRADHVTGDIQIHEMAFAGNELWFVNTRFSCLCTLEHPHSFKPRWIPPFAKGLSADDRCHLNGLAVADGAVKYVTAFATSDEPQGWRPTKATSGLVMEVPSGRIVTQGLSMPHSPRYYANHLWVLDSGRGTIVLVDPATGSSRTFAQMSGFTRGLDFFGSIAFIGLSRVRESNVFGGLPLTERIEEKDRFCGVQALNVSTGKVEGFVKFESGVNEIFAVQVLRGMAYPHILEGDDALIDTCYALAPEDLRLVRPTEPAAS
jgi:uncharacterized protein (TIGR03032 family)